MAKLINNDIELRDMQKYLDSSSDFAFEMRVLKLLNDKGLETTFGGLYQDPNGNKTRQFDIRSRIIFDSNCTKHSVWLAIECKNLRNNFPLLISCSKRKDNESILDTFNAEYNIKSMDENCTDDCSARNNTSYNIYSQSLQPSAYYTTKAFVGRTCVQVGKSPKGEIEFSDEEVYSKWTQSLCSLYGLMEVNITDIYKQICNPNAISSCNCFVPIVAVPDGTLWIAEYTDNGELLTEPKKVEKCSFLVNKQYSFCIRIKSHPYMISHIDFMTFTGLKNFLSQEDIHRSLFQKC